MNRERVRDAYGTRAREYIDLFGSVEAVDRDDLAIMRRWAERVVGPALDVGCGPGHLTNYLYNLGIEISGIDPVPRFVAHARVRYPGPVFSIGSAETLPVADGSVAGILAWYSLIHLPPTEFEGVLGEFRRALAPGGMLLLGFFEGAAVEEFDHKVVAAYRWPVAELVGRLVAAGFEELERTTRPAVMHPAGPQRPHGAVLARVPR